MEKKQYIEPRMNVRVVNLLLLQAFSDGEGGDLQFSKDVNLPEEDGEGVSTHDIWED